MTLVAKDPSTQSRITNGSPRPWETDFHLALPVDEFVDRLSDETEWSDDDLDAARRRAHEAREIEQLPRLAPSESQIRAFLTGLGIDLREGSTARLRRPGILKNLFGR